MCDYVWFLQLLLLHLHICVTPWKENFYCQRNENSEDIRVPGAVLSSNAVNDCSPPVL